MAWIIAPIFIAIICLAVLGFLTGSPGDNVKTLSGIIPGIQQALDGYDFVSNPARALTTLGIQELMSVLRDFLGPPTLSIKYRIIENLIMAFASGILVVLLETVYHWNINAVGTLFFLAIYYLAGRGNSFGVGFFFDLFKNAVAFAVVAFLLGWL